jgi:hypothetical protein
VRQLSSLQDDTFVPYFSGLWADLKQKMLCLGWDGNYQAQQGLHFGVVSCQEWVFTGAFILYSRFLKFTVNWNTILVVYSDREYSNPEKSIIYSGIDSIVHFQRIRLDHEEEEYFFLTPKIRDMTKGYLDEYTHS